MLDRIDPGRHRSRDALAADRVGGHAPIPLVRFVDRGVELRRRERREGRSDARGDTPPVATTLIAFAPALISSRTARADCVAPSTSRANATL